MSTTQTEQIFTEQIFTKQIFAKYLQIFTNQTNFYQMFTK